MISSVATEKMEFIRKIAKKGFKISKSNTLKFA